LFGFPGAVEAPKHRRQRALRIQKENRNARANVHPGPGVRGQFQTTQNLLNILGRAAATFTSGEEELPFTGRERCRTASIVLAMPATVAASSYSASTASGTPYTGAHSPISRTARNESPPSMKKLSVSSISCSSRISLQ